MYSKHPSQGSGGGDVGRQGSAPACLVSSPASLYPSPVKARLTPGSGLARARQAGPEQIPLLRAPSGPSAPVPLGLSRSRGERTPRGVPCSDAGPSCGSLRRVPGRLVTGEGPQVEAGPRPGEDPEVGSLEGEGGAERTGAAAACSSCFALSLLVSRKGNRRALRSTGDAVPSRAGQAPCLTGWRGPPPAVMAGRGSPRGWRPGAPSAAARGSPGCNGRAPSAPARGSPGCNARAARHQSWPSVPGCNGQAPKGEGGSRSVGVPCSNAG